MVTRTIAFGLAFASCIGVTSAYSDNEPEMMLVVGGGQHSDRVQFTIAIHSDSPTGHAAAGRVTFKEPGQPKVHADITCLIVVGNEAFATGQITRPGSAAGSLIVMHAVDSGNPSDVVPDLLRFSFDGYIVPAPDQPGCYLPVLEPVPVTNGNILIGDSRSISW